VGQKVIVTSYELGAGQWGAWSERIRVPADWVVPLPAGLDLRSAMVFGTAGFTAALSVWQLQRHEITADRGPIAVSGASGGVGIIAVKLLRHLGYQVTAISGKAERIEMLKQMGATDVLTRDAAVDQSTKPLLPARWAGVVDTVGGPLLASLVRASQPGACVTACGMVGGVDIPISVYPFILRGVTLAGIDSAWTPRVLRGEIWQRLAQQWNVSQNLESIVDEVTLDDLEPRIDTILRGAHVGRTIVRL
jgi:putative YhdH/YhfP family quinone oxidoreductase